MKRCGRSLVEGVKILMSRSFWVAFRHYYSPTTLSARLDRWLVARHNPEYIAGGEVYCRLCVKPWPCAEVSRLKKRG